MVKKHTLLFSSFRKFRKKDGRREVDSVKLKQRKLKYGRRDQTGENNLACKIKSARVVDSRGHGQCLEGLWGGHREAGCWLLAPIQVHLPTAHIFLSSDN